MKHLTFKLLILTSIGFAGVFISCGPASSANNRHSKLAVLKDSLNILLEGRRMQNEKIMEVQAQLSAAKVIMLDLEAWKTEETSPEKISLVNKQRNIIAGLESREAELLKRIK
jgi:hypothetical protein